MFGLVAPPATFAVPSPKLQENEYGAEPPDADAVKLTGVPTVPVVGAVVKTTVNVRGAMVMLAEAVASLPLVSVTLTLTVNVPFVA